MKKKTPPDLTVIHQKLSDLTPDAKPDLEKAINGLAIKTRQALIPISQLIYLRRNPQYLTPHQMEALKTSIQRDGFLSPILVRSRGRKFELLSGNHRAMAAAELGLEKVPAVIAELTDDQAKRIAINLNTIHGDPTAELLAPFLGEFDAELLSTVHLGESLRKEIINLDENLGKAFASMEIPRCLEQRKQQQQHCQLCLPDLRQKTYSKSR